MLVKFKNSRGIFAPLFFCRLVITIITGYSHLVKISGEAWYPPTPPDIFIDARTAYNLSIF